MTGYLFHKNIFGYASDINHDRFCLSPFFSLHGLHNSSDHGVMVSQELPVIPSKVQVEDLFYPILFNTLVIMVVLLTMMIIMTVLSVIFEEGEQQEFTRQNSTSNNNNMKMINVSHLNTPQPIYSGFFS